MAAPFYKRFNIEINLAEGQRRFINRIRIITQSAIQLASLTTADYNRLLQKIGFELGEQFEIEEILFFPDTIIGSFMEKWSKFVGKDFSKCLWMTETLHEELVKKHRKASALLVGGIEQALEQSEVDLNVAWNIEIFTRKGAQFLDEKLVNDPLHWLRDQKYANSLAPFEKGLKHWMEGQKDPTRYGDVVTDMYEAVEALAKIVTGRDKDLSANREAFASKLKLPKQYKMMLKEYVDFGCEYRHSPETNKSRTYPSEKDTETFIYMTGIFIRLAVQSK